ncbi:TIGR03364 family FAD-dependent oxidoreductase [Elioraea rosea]|uniref:TIGR03364 family FAD-dependent oxidoreductase n=1 Tax=Elioraea rosea TaxID=2492390 RepID=UPI001184712F|nr:TIGR03364 family FAD-dependent oxidoreductase [Elioraea rosea]
MSDLGEVDLAIVGAGIVGLAHALAAARAGLRVAVLEREARANGASVRNFGFVTVTGQGAGDTWRRARRARDIWAEVAPRAGIAVLHRGLILACRRAEAMAVAEEFAAGPMGAGCRLLTPTELGSFGVFADGLAGGLHSPHELRVEPREALPKLASWLEAEHGVRFLWRTHVRAVDPPAVETSAGRLRACRVVVAPCNDFLSLFPETIAAFRPVRCKLHMLRLPDPGWRLPATVMSDLGLVRYLGYADAPSLPALRARLEAEQRAQLEDGIHLIVVQSADGSLVVGDSHHYGDTPDPFMPEAVDARILAEAQAVLRLPREMHPIERWIGEYPSADVPAFIAAPMPEVRVVMVTSGTGMSTAFAIAEETLAGLAVRTATE